MIGQNLRYHMSPPSPSLALKLSLVGFYILVEDPDFFGHQDLLELFAGC